MYVFSTNLFLKFNTLADNSGSVCIPFDFILIHFLLFLLLPYDCGNNQTDAECCIMDNWFSNAICRFEYKAGVGVARFSWFSASYQCTGCENAIVCIKLSWLGAIHTGRFCSLDYRTRYSIRSGIARSHSSAINWINGFWKSWQCGRTTATCWSYGGN